ncbi:MAG: protein kinase [Planctomycetales bacterium]|nr:protein kinase [Planctomycetales bacterium]
MRDTSPTPSTVFSQAIEIESTEERNAFLEEACGQSPQLRKEVERLISNHFQAGLFLEKAPAQADSILESWRVETGDQIGPYKIREKIGEGGMGIVYVAEQTQPVQRKVALKVIKPGMDSREVIARFDAERQALAAMDHPNIARILDAGITESGRPFFAMELVRGIPITEFCDQVTLSPRERLQLFCDVCQAVQHAHQKGIIHRDIKPSNVLITQIDGKPIVKIIDFGLAKATGGQRLTDKSIYTQFMKFMGTPAYMSPEQAGLSGVDIDTRSDIYSLGILLYVLLTGNTPISEAEVSSASYEEICRKVREVEAPKPSSRAHTLNDADRTTVAKQRKVDPNKLVYELRGELDWIVLKALEKDRTRRYSSAEAFREDILRHLNGQPVAAVAPSASYLFRKYASRHRAVFMTAGAFVTMMLIATVISCTLAVHAQQQSTLAKSKSERLEEEKTRTQSALELAKQNEDTAKRSAELATELNEKIKLDNDRLVRLNYANTIMQCQLEIENENYDDARRLLDATTDYPEHGFEWYHLQQVLNGDRFCIPTQAGGAVAFHPAGDRIAFCEWRSGRLRLLDNVNQIPEERAFPKPAARPIDVTFSADGNRMAVVTRDAMVEIYDVASNKLFHRLDHHSVNDAFFAANTIGLDFSPTANELMTCDNTPDDSGTRVRLWNVETGEVKRTIIVPDDPDAEPTTQPRVRYSPDATRISLSTNGKVLVIDLATEETIVSLPNEWYRRRPCSCEFSPDGTRLAWMEHTPNDGLYRARVLEIDSLQPLFDIVFDESADKVTFSPDGKWIAVVDERGVSLWDAGTGDFSMIFPSGWAEFAFSRDGSTLVTCPNESFRIWDVERNSGFDELVHYGDDEDEQGFGGPLSGAWSPDGTQLMLGGEHGAVELWNTRTLQRKLFLSNDGQKQHAAAIDWSQDGSMIAFGIEGEWDAQRRIHHGFVRVFDARTRRLIKELRDHDRLSRDVEFSPDGAWLVAEHDDGQLTRWDTVTWTAKTLVVPSETPEMLLYGNGLAFSFSPEGRELAVASAGPRVDYLDVESGQILRTHAAKRFITNPQSEIEQRASREVNSIAFSSGKPVVLAMPGGFTVLERETGDELYRVPQKLGSQLTAMFSPEGHIVTGSYHSKTVRFFSAQDGHEVFRIEGPPGTAAHLTLFSPDHSQLFVGGQFRLRGTIHRAMPRAEYARRAALRDEWGDRTEPSPEPSESTSDPPG